MTAPTATHPLIKFPDTTISLPLRYYGSVGYYALMAAHPRAIIEDNALYDKRQKAVHRCDIADTHGPVSLTVPVGKPHGIKQARWTDVPLSAHGAWWHVHRVTLESAYGRTPFFEYYIDDLLPYLTPSVVDLHPTIASLTLAIDATLRRLLHLPTEVVAATAANQSPASPTTSDPSDWSDPSDSSDRATPTLGIAAFPPYYQLRAASHGFLPNLSILDLLFNLGPEAPLYLHSLIPNGVTSVDASLQI